MDSPTLTLRRTTPADLAALDLLFSRSYPALLKADYPPSTLMMALPLISRAQPRLVGSGSYWCAQAEGTIVAADGAGPARRAAPRPPTWPMSATSSPTTGMSARASAGR
jgi:hypothetical protein